MQVKVTCTLNLTDGMADVNRLEEAVFKLGLKFMAELMARALAALDEQSEKVCPDCSAQEPVSDGTALYQLRTRFGTVPIKRRQYRCKGCGRAFRPLDKVLSRAGPGRATQGLAKLAVLAAASWPFGTAARVINQLCGAEVSPEWVRQVAESEGKAQAEQTREVALSVIESRAGVEPLTESRQLLVELDGCWVKSRDNPEGMECKVGVVASGKEQTGKERFKLTDRRYAATFLGVEVFGPLVYVEAAELGIEGAEEVVVLGDGADWIDTVACRYFPGSERRLDVWHLLKRCREAVRAERLEPGEAGKLMSELSKLLWCGQVGEALRVVRARLKSQVGLEFAGYLQNQRSWIVNAQQLKARGEVVGSGAVEKAADIVVSRRFKRRGMSWRRAGAEAIVALRADILNQAAA